MELGWKWEKSWGEGISHWISQCQVSQACNFPSFFGTLESSRYIHKRGRHGGTTPTIFGVKCDRFSMDYQKFIQHLPHLYDDWGEESVSPKSDRFQAVIKQVRGMTTSSVLQLLNWAVECMEVGEVYCEIGCFQGATLIGALLDRTETVAYAVDNFSEFDIDGKNLEQLVQNLTKFDLEENVIFCNQDFEDFFGELRDLKFAEKIGVYFYDGAHDYRSQLLGLLFAIPFLAARALIIVDDSNNGEVQQANWDFIAAHPQCKMLVDLPTAKNGDRTFWNGLQVLSWDIDRGENYTVEELRQQRNEKIIDGIYNLQFGNLEKTEELSI